MEIETWRYLLYAVVVIGIFLSLLIYALFLWGSKKRGAKIEKRGEILFSDFPMEER